MEKWLNFSTILTEEKLGSVPSSQNPVLEDSILFSGHRGVPKVMQFVYTHIVSCKYMNQKRLKRVHSRGTHGI